MSLSSDIYSAKLRLNQAILTGYDLADDLYWTGVFIKSENFSSAGDRLKGMRPDFQDYIEQTTTQYSYQHYHLINALSWIDDNWPEVTEYELTWQKIIAAWAADNFEGRFWTIAFIDRMRQIIWDEPFYIAWAAKPEDKEL